VVTRPIILTWGRDVGYPHQVSRAHGILGLCVACVACETDPEATGQCNDATDPYADCVHRFAPAEDASFGHEALPEIVLGAPGGLMDVVSLGCGGEIELELDPPIVDGPGADFIVFENPFGFEFPEPGEVSVSIDGEDWHPYLCEPVTLEGCAGVTPTLAGPDSGLAPTDPEVAGGDAFDLAEVGLSEVGFVRIVDRSAEYWSPLGESYCSPPTGAGGFDLDAVAAVHTAK
jgi:hypothetical protein